MTAYRFPSEKSKHLRSVGKVLPRLLGKILQDLGFDVWVNPGQGNGVDIKLFDSENKLILVTEVLNWSDYSRLSAYRIHCIVDNLTSYDCTRLLIYTGMRNEELLEELSEFDISILKIGYQVLTAKSYQFYEAKNQVVNRKIHNTTVRRDIKLKLKECLEKLDIQFPSSIELAGQ